MSRQPDVWYLPQDLYDEIMSRPDGADLSDLFEFVDPQWAKQGFTFTKADGAPS